MYGGRQCFRRGRWKGGAPPATGQAHPAYTFLPPQIAYAPVLVLSLRTCVPPHTVVAGQEDTCVNDVKPEPSGDSTGEGSEEEDAGDNEELPKPRACIFSLANTVSSLATAHRVSSHRVPCVSNGTMRTTGSLPLGLTYSTGVYAGEQDPAEAVVPPEAPPAGPESRPEDGDGKDMH